MVKVALIAPGKDERFAVQEPLNLGYIASYLEKNDIDVKIIDQLAKQDVKKELSKYNPDIVGITAVTPLVSEAYKIADMCREWGIKTIMGGPHPSILPKEALQHADIVVKGEGERAMLDIARNNVKSRIVTLPYIKDIDTIPPPARHLLQMDFYLRTKDRLKNTYLHFVPPNTKTAALLSSRGCPYSCTFCHNTWRGTPYRFNSVKRVISEIEHLIRQYSVEAIFFIEDNFFLKKSRVNKICNSINENGFDIIWGANARVDNIDLETLQTAKDAGCKQVTFGFESGSQKILDILNKKTTVEQNQRAIELCREVGITPNGTFMIGNPSETIEDIQKTQQFIRDNNIEDCVGICITTPFPGTELWNWCEERNLIPKRLEWHKFTYDEIPIPVCDSIPPVELQQLYYEIADELNAEKPLKFKDVKKFFISPFNSTMKIIKYPSRVLKIAKRLLK